MKYEEPTQEVIDEIKGMFALGYCASSEFEFHTTSDGYLIETKQMYDHVGFKGSVLQGMHRIAELLKCNEGDESNRYSHSGCETCDYGSVYGVSWRFWRSQ